MGETAVNDRGRERGERTEEVATSALLLHIPLSRTIVPLEELVGAGATASLAPLPALPVRLLHAARDACLTRASRPTVALRRQCPLNAPLRDLWPPRARRNERTFDLICAPKRALLGTRSGADSAGLRFIL